MTALTNRKRPRRRNEGELRAELRARYFDSTAIDRMHGKQLDTMEGLSTLLALSQRREGNALHRTWKQLAQGLRWDVAGMSIEEVHLHYRTNLRNAVRYLRECDIVAGVTEQRNAQGEGTGILIEMVPGAFRWILEATRGCSSVGFSATPRRPGNASSPRTARRAVLENEPDFRPSPLGGRGVEDLQRPSFNPPSPSSSTAVRVRAQNCSETRDRSHLAATVRAALLALKRDRNEIVGSEALEAHPWLVAVPADILAREAYRLSDPPPAPVFAPLVWRGADLRISPVWRDRLLRAASVLERALGSPVRAAERIIDIANGEWYGDGWAEPYRIGKPVPHRHKPGRTVRLLPQNLGGIAVCIRRDARREAKARRAG